MASSMLAQLRWHLCRQSSVPEEGADDVLKSVEYAGFQAIMGPPEHMDASSMMEEVSTPNTVVATSGPVSNSTAALNDDTNMLELNTPLNSLPFNEIEQQFATRDTTTGMLLSNNSSSAGASEAGTTTDDALMSDTLMQNATRSKHYGNVTENQRQFSSDHASGKSVMKGRISKSFQRLYRREPHNYDKAQPTYHQTTIYQQILAEQQKNQLQTHNITNTGAATAYPNTQQQQQQQLCYQYQPAGSNTTTNATDSVNYVYGAAVSDASSIMNLQAAKASTNYGAIRGNLTQQQVANSLMMNVKIEPPCTDVLSMFDLSTGNQLAAAGITSSTSSELYCNTKAQYKPYMATNAPPQHNFKKSSSTGTFVNVRGLVPTVNNYLLAQQQAQSTMEQQQQQQQQQQQIQHTQSLPLNLPAMNLNAQQHQQQMNSIALHQQQQQQQQRAQLQLTPANSQQQLLVIDQQQLQQQQVIYPKEMFRSNSLPLNVTLQKADNFVVPKYPQSVGKNSNVRAAAARSRSNSMQPNILMNSSGIEMATVYTGPSTLTTAASSAPDNNATNANRGRINNLLMAPPLQNATSDPMLNSTLAQLLTSNTRMPQFNNKQSQQQQSASTNNLFSTTAAGTTTVAPTTKDSNMNCSLGLAAVRAQQEMQRQLQLQQQAAKQSKSPKKSQSLPVNPQPNFLHSPPTKMKSFPLTGMTGACSANVLTGSSSGGLSLSPESFHDQDSPLSPTHSLTKFPRDSQRRAGHIHAEQKRRYNIKNGFDMLHSLIPQLQQNPNVKSALGEKRK